MIKKLISSAVLLGGVVAAFGGSAHALNIGIGLGAGADASQSSSVASSSLVNVNLGAGLQAQLQTVSDTTSSIDAVVQLQGNAPALIQTNGDLTAYNTLVVKARPAITAINTQSDGSVAIAYKQPAKLFGIFSTSLSGEVDVDAEGNTTVHMPWYAIFYAKDTADVRSSVAAAVQESNTEIAANVSAGATAQGELQNTARVINAATAALQAQIQSTASASIAAQ